MDAKNLEQVVQEGEEISCNLKSSVVAGAISSCQSTSLKTFPGERPNTSLEELFSGVNLAYKASRFNWHRGKTVVAVVVYHRTKESICSATSNVGCQLLTSESHYDSYRV